MTTRTLRKRGRAIAQGLVDRLARRESEAQYRILVEQSIVGICVVQDRRYVYMNPRFCEIFGRCREELMAVPDVVQTVSQRDQARVSDMFQRCLDGEAVHDAYCTRHSDGRELEIEVFAARSKYLGRSAVLGTVMDITARKRAQDEIRSLARFPDENPRPNLASRARWDRAVREQSE